MKRTFLLITLLLMITHMQAQTVEGVVTDAATGAPVEMANVRLLYGSGAKLAGFGLTDTKGAFSVKVKEADSLQVAISLLGYKELRRAVVPGQSYAFRLEEEAYVLKEVEIRPGRVFAVGDTINYNVDDFLSTNDQSIQDVIKKLPGVDVKESGAISYMGKDISKLYVEGMDMTDGRYGRITRNLRPESVDKVQLLDGHQPIRSLQKTLKTEDIAMNLKLKPQFRDLWMLHAGTGLGYGDELLWKGELNAMQLGRANQSSYGYKGNNVGEDVTAEQQLLSFRSDTKLAEPAAVSFLSQPSLSAPLRQDRWLFNDAHTLSGNRLYKLSETKQLRLNAMYIHDQNQQERGSETAWYYPGDTITIQEQRQASIRKDQAELGLNFENNADDYYMTNRFTAAGDWTKSHTGILQDETPIDQRIKTTNLRTRNLFRTLWNRDKLTYEVTSLLRYNHQPSLLQTGNIHQQLNVNQFYTDNSFNLIYKKGLTTQQYTAGMTGQANSIQNGYSAYLLPSLQTDYRKFRLNLVAPLVWTDYTGTDFSRFAVNPSLSLIYKLNYAWRFTLAGRYNEQYGGLTNFYTNPYQTSYLYLRRNFGTPEVRQTQNYSLYGEYRSTIREFFASLSLSYTHARSDQMIEQFYENDLIVNEYKPIDNTSEAWSLGGSLSKGFFDYGLKTALNFSLSQREAEQIMQGVRTPYRSRSVFLEPKISWTPNKYLETAYEATFTCTENKIERAANLSPLWNIVQKLNVSYGLTDWTLNASVDHYYNDVSADKGVNAFFANLSLTWKCGRWYTVLSANNLLNKQQYSYTQYSAVQSYSSWINIRGREFLLSVRYRF